MIKSHTLIKELMCFSREAYDLKLVDSFSGNSSVRHGNSIYISATGTCLGRLKKRDIAEVSLDGTHIKHMPSKEIDGHLVLYKNHKDVNAVLHVHGEYIAAYSAIAEPGNDDYPAMCTAPAWAITDKIPVMEYFHPCLNDNYERFLKIGRGSTIFIQQNHGIFIGAKSMKQAVFIAEILEENFKVYFIALSSGKHVKVLTQAQKTELFTRSYLS